MRFLTVEIILSRVPPKGRYLSQLPVEDGKFEKIG